MDMFLKMLIHQLNTLDGEPNSAMAMKKVLFDAKI